MSPTTLQSTDAVCPPLGFCHLQHCLARGRHFIDICEMETNEAILCARETRARGFRWWIGITDLVRTHIGPSDLCACPGPPGLPALASVPCSDDTALSKWQEPRPDELGLILATLPVNDGTPLHVGGVVLVLTWQVCCEF